MHIHEKPSQVLRFIANREAALERSTGTDIPMPGEVWTYVPKEVSESDFMFGGTSSYHAVTKVEFTDTAGNWVYLSQLGTMPEGATIQRRVLLHFFIESYTLVSGRYS